MSNKYKDWLRDKEEEERIKRISISSNDVIVHKVDFNEFTADECFDMHKQLQKEFPNNKIITIPYTSCIEAIDKKSVIKYLKKMIKELEKE